MQIFYALKTRLLILCFLLISFAGSGQAPAYKVVAYYSGDSSALARYDFRRITHLIYGFAHVDSTGNFVVSRNKDTAVLKAFERIKKQYPHLKTMIALGGWGGCAPCSGVFDNPVFTKRFVQTSKSCLAYFNLDGIDLDWEYPAIEGHPGHSFLAADRSNFSNLIILLRKALGNKKLISFAAGGFQKFLDQSVEWDRIAPVTDFVNLMTYDLVHGYSTLTGHQSALYSSHREAESINRAVEFFKSKKFPLHKVIIGAPFYVRAFEVEDSTNNGLFQPAKFLFMSAYRRNIDSLTTANGYVRYWDDQAQAPYWFNKERKLFITGDDPVSLRLKLDYIQKNQLGGFMFWELDYDLYENGLLDQIRFK